jgi:mono/diheme cytochrome c family protein
MMARPGFWLLLLLSLLACASARRAGAQEEDRAIHDRQSFELIARGRYLAIAADCAACHTERGGQLYAGGNVVETPFGKLLAPNLTPDRETGIGAWSDEEFVAAVREGGGRSGHLYPAMPYTYYTRMPRADVLAIRAYLETLPPVRHRVISNQLPFPFDIRASMVAWNALFFSPGEFKPAAGKSAAWNRGAYLVEGPGHCGMCHTAKNFLGGDETDHRLQGGVLQGWFSPDLTGAPRRGLADWSGADIVAYLRSGQNRFAAASGPMAEVIADSTSHLTDSDLKAIAVYLKDSKPPEEPAPQPVLPGYARRQGALSRQLRGLPREQRRRRGEALSAAQGQPGGAVERSHHAHRGGAARDPERRDRRGADRRRHATLRLAAHGRASGFRAHLYPQRLGQRRLPRLGGGHRRPAPARLGRAALADPAAGGRAASQRAIAAANSRTSLWKISRKASATRERVVCIGKTVANS